MQLRELREKVGRSQRKLAKDLGVSQPRVSSIERSDDLRISTLKRYVEALGGELHVVAVFDEIEVPLKF